MFAERVFLGTTPCLLFTQLSIPLPGALEKGCDLSKGMFSTLVRAEEGLWKLRLLGSSRELAQQVWGPLFGATVLCGASRTFSSELAGWEQT